MEHTTPSRAVKKRQRRRVSDIASSPDVSICWTNRVTHLIAKCVNGGEDDAEDGYGGNTDSSSSPRGQKTGKRKLFSDPSPAKSGRWVLIRSLKYLKALVGGRWIVSDEWLQGDLHAQITVGTYIDCSDVGTMLFADFFFHVIGEFLPPMPPTAELNTLICMGGGKLIPFMDDIPNEMRKHETRSRKLIIVSDKLNPRALHEQTKQLRALPQLRVAPSTIIVNYLWVINSISEAKLRDLP
ncbi:hypothetical protein BBI17_002158 [Phytophthora kernoviae]|uniref:BRCT domain-containing protein n=1 Tax=Phytophthora kernoviae TaxID=325452 RepID=A0A421EX71_9STRA|nr:hypothetical protein BBI17_002158 [Phytophthora kernoviae]